VKQLGILDSAFVNLEQPNTPQHVGGLGIYDPSTAPGGFVRFKQVIANFEARLNRLPLFRTRLVEVPGGVDRPYWVKDANFDVEFHLRHIALPQPGDWRQLCIQVARLHARPLDMARPLWECYVIEGLDNIPNLPKGSFAVYTKMHHSLVDGAGGASFMAALHDLEAEPSPAEDEVETPLLVDRSPTPAELLGRAGFNQARNSIDMARGAIGLTRDVSQFALKLLRKQIPMPDVQAPRTRFNGPVGPYRVFEATTFPMEEFKAVKNATGVKLNDVGLAVVAGALARYLDSKGETPQGALAAGLPVNLRTRRAATDDNNQVGSIFTSLHTDVRDPVERLKAIFVSTSEAKEFGESSPMLDTIKAAGVLTPAITRAAASLWSRRNLSRFIPLNVSTVITNVPGPNFDLFCAGARLVQYQGLGLLTPGVGMFHTIFTQAETVNMSVLGDRDILPDPDAYMACLRESWLELRDAVLSPPGRARRPSAKKAGATKRPAAKARGKATTKKAPGKKAAAKRTSAATKPVRKSPAKAKKPTEKPSAPITPESSPDAPVTGAGVVKASARTQAKRAAAVKKATANSPGARPATSPVRPVAVNTGAAPRLRARRKASGVAPKLKVVSG
jgi:WS/DGAT/MGAT family acyltransferase